MVSLGFRGRPCFRDTRDDLERGLCKGRTGFCDPNTTFGIQGTSCNAAAADRRKMNVGYAEVLTKLARFVLFGYNKFQ